MSSSLSSKSARRRVPTLLHSDYVFLVNKYVKVVEDILC